MDLMETQTEIIDTKHNGGKIMKRLTRVQNGKMICGVCAGIGQYFNIDPTLVRLGAALLTMMFGSGILVYIAAALIIPVETNIVE